MATRTPPAPPEPQTKSAQDVSEEHGVESVRAKLHDALALLAEALSELDALEQKV